MADSLSASLLGMLDMHSVGGIAGALEASEQAVLQGLKSSIASVLGGMASKSEDPNALRNILDLASNSSGDATPTQMAHAAEDTNSPLISGGRRLLSGLFANTQPAATDAVSSASGLRTNTASTILAMAAAMVMSFLNKKVRVEGMNMDGLGSLLQRESTTRNAFPPGLAHVFWPAIVRSTSPVVAQAVERAHSLFRWLPLLALLALSIPGVLWLLNHARKPIVPSVAPVRTEVSPVTTETTPLGTANRAATGVMAILLSSTSDSGRSLGDPVSNRKSALFSSARFTMSTESHPDVHLKVAGYTANVGRAVSRISSCLEKRANSVMAELVSKSVSADGSVPRDKARSTPSMTIPPEQAGP